MPPSSRQIRDAGRRRRPDDDHDDTPLSRGSTQRLHDRSAGKHKAPQTRMQTQMQTPAERAALAEVQELKAELAKVRADAAAAVALAAEREPHGLGGSIDRLRSRAFSYIYFIMPCALLLSSSSEAYTMLCVCRHGRPCGVTASRRVTCQS
jgi:hypothetical protein